MRSRAFESSWQLGFFCFAVLRFPLRWGPVPALRNAIIPATRCTGSVRWAVTWNWRDALTGAQQESTGENVGKPARPWRRPVIPVVSVGRSSASRPARRGRRAPPNPSNNPQSRKGGSPVPPGSRQALGIQPVSFPVAVIVERIRAGRMTLGSFLGSGMDTKVGVVTIPAA